MNTNMQRIIAIAGTLIVGLIGIFMFAMAAQPMSGEGRVAQEWVNALCERRIDDLYRLSAVSPATGPLQFHELAQNYLESGIPVPCRGQVDFNLVKNLAVPDSLLSEVKSIRFFSDTMLYGESDDKNMAISLWLYDRGSEWRVWSSFMGPTYDRPAAPEHAEPILDSSSTTIGYARIHAPIMAYKVENGALVGIPIEMQTLSQPWERYEAQLFAGGHRIPPIDNENLLPPEWQADFLPPIGGYIPQQIEQYGVLWFRLPSLNDMPITLAFTAGIAYSGTVKSIFLDVPTTDMIVLKPFNAFADAAFLKIDYDNPEFEVYIDTTGFPSSKFRVECSHFILVLVDNQWLRATDCTLPDGFEEDFLPGETALIKVTFAGYNVLNEDSMASLIYRRTDGEHILRYNLWTYPRLQRGYAR